MKSLYKDKLILSLICWFLVGLCFGIYSLYVLLAPFYIQDSLN